MYAAHNGTAWAPRWVSGDDPDWYINSQGAELIVAPDLGTITVIGPGVDTTALFDESAADLRRSLRVVWEQAEGGYHPVPSPANFSDRFRWFWQVSQPAPYTSLVEFMERLVYREQEGLGRLMASSEVLEAARAFGLDRAGRHFHVTASTTAPATITFRDDQGAFVATFA